MVSGVAEKRKAKRTASGAGNRPLAGGDALSEGWEEYADLPVEDMSLSGFLNEKLSRDADPDDDAVGPWDLREKWLFVVVAMVILSVYAIFVYFIDQDELLPESHDAAGISAAIQRGRVEDVVVSTSPVGAVSAPVEEQMDTLQTAEPDVASGENSQPVDDRVLLKILTRQ
ncbi:MAG: hypothetical protein IT567_02065 [Alphaproteobacteria bacterium]|nr:hypothetical protein [Alphaproteobacteria bacterium]